VLKQRRACAASGGTRQGKGRCQVRTDGRRSHSQKPEPAGGARPRPGRGCEIARPVRHVASLRKLRLWEPSQHPGRMAERKSRDSPNRNGTREPLAQNPGKEQSPSSRVSPGEQAANSERGGRALNNTAAPQYTAAGNRAKPGEARGPRGPSKGGPEMQLPGGGRANSST